MEEGGTNPWAYFVKPLLLTTELCCYDPITSHFSIPSFWRLGFQEINFGYRIQIIASTVN
jgi:hypothetical protein